MSAPARATTQIYRERLGELTAPGAPVYLMMLRVMTRIDARAKYYLNGVMVAKHTGNLLSSQQPPTVMQVGINLLGEAVNTATYVLPVHDGSRPHVIAAVNAKVLRFEGSVANQAAGTGGGRTGTGQFIYRQSVHHPGTQPRPFLRRAMEDVIAETIHL